MIDFAKVQGTYLRDILDQPRALRDTIESLQPAPVLHSLAEDLRAARYRRIVLTGMGGSYQILHPLHLQLVAADFHCVMAETSELLYSMPALLNGDSAVLAVSQSGASAEIVKLLDAATVHVAISNTPESPLATRARSTVLTRAGEEGGVSCKTAVTSLAALHWVAQHLAGGSLDQAKHDLLSAAASAGQYLSSWQDHVSALADRLRNIRRVFFAGRGASLAAAGLGAMVQKEAAHFHGEGMSSAALRHGPFEMLGPDCCVVVFEGDPHVRELHERLVRHIRGTGALVSLCGFSVASGPFALPRTPNSLRPILELLPTQMMSLALGYLMGREPGKFERITKVTTEE